ncbi:4'-phosphopantetheinyl transferase superfamily protein [Capnocytophaga sp. ARDL2]|uniref:4'-phosphopantetheinyl transferase superfamily protein n=1 Tax=Capnocytophaga sp. ARDL2 TaxID=3238809 RepID=UPI003555DFBA
MPLVLQKSFNNNCTLFIWKITENIEKLSFNIDNNPLLNENFSHLKTDLQKKTFFSQRKLLQLANIKEEDFFYESSGKPMLNNGLHISFSHSFEYVAMAIHHLPVGIDIEKIRPKLANVKRRFIDSEENFISQNEQLNYLAIIWSAKESIYKTNNLKGIDATKEMHIRPFQLQQNQFEGYTTQNNIKIEYQGIFDFLEDFVWTVVWEK